MGKRVTVLEVIMVTVALAASIGCDADPAGIPAKPQPPKTDSTASPAPPAPAPVLYRLTAVSPANFPATAGAALVRPLSVVVRDTANRPVPGMTVKFLVVKAPEPRCRIAMPMLMVEPSAVTDADGIATLTSLTVGSCAGDYWIDAFPAVGPYLGASFIVTATAGGPDTLRVVSPTGPLAGGFGNDVIRWPGVVVEDHFGNGVPGTKVRFALTAGPGSRIGQDTATSDRGGWAGINYWQLGSSRGLYEISASVGRAESQITAFVFPANRITRYELYWVDTDFPNVQLGYGAPGSYGIVSDVFYLSDTGYFVEEVVGSELEGRNSGRYEVAANGGVTFTAVNSYMPVAESRLVGNELTVKRTEPLRFSCCYNWYFAKRID